MAHSTPFRGLRKLGELGMRSKITEDLKNLAVGVGAITVLFLLALLLLVLVLYAPYLLFGLLFVVAFLVISYLRYW